ncbi:MAG TPA: site-specific integrase [Methylomirabilota bacterium]|nr:site-specific integrase [Methylomirabilota bacterium]
MGVTVREKPKGSSVWWVFIAYRGQRRARRVGIGKSGKRLAEAAAIRIQARLLDGDVSDLAHAPIMVHPSVITFAAFTESWLAWYPGIHAVRPGTMENHRSAIRSHLIPFFGSKSISAITTDLIEDFIASRRAPGGSVRREGKALSDTSLKVVLGTLKLILDRAVRRGLLPTNPMSQADWRALPRVENVDPFTGLELRAILTSASSVSSDFATLLRVWAQTGMREGELLGLKRSDLDLDAGAVRIERTWTRGRIGPTKTGSTRTVSLVHPVAEDTPEWQATPGRRTVLAGLRALRVSAMDPEGYLFGSGTTPMDDTELRRLWRKTLHRAAVRYRPPETLRHTFASTLLSRNAPLLYVQQAGGWKNATVLLKHYSKWMPQPQPSATQVQPRADGAR